MTVFFTDPVTGNKPLTQFFLGVLPFNSYFFREFVWDQKLSPSSPLIAVQSRMFAYFGGTTPYVVVIAKAIVDRLIHPSQKIT